MSGGSYNYAYSHIEEMAEGLRHTDLPRRAAFQKLLRLVAVACKEIEWEDSADGGDERAAIAAVFAFLKADAATIKKARAYDVVIERLRVIVDEERP